MVSKIFLAACLASIATAAELALRSHSVNLQSRWEGSRILGRQLEPVLCSEQGLPSCGSPTNCIEIGYTCCPSGGGCAPDTNCWTPGPGQSGEPGCCPKGETCSGGGGTDVDSSIKTLTNTNTIASTRTNTIPQATSSATPKPPVSSTEKPPVYGSSSVAPAPPAYSSTAPAHTYSTSLPIVTGTGVAPAPTNGTAPTATGEPPAFTGAAVKGAVPAAIMGVAAVAGYLVL